MWVVRPVREGDLDAIIALSKEAMLVHTLPRTPDDINRCIERSLLSFSRSVEIPGDEYYFLVLQNSAGSLSGVAAVSATAGVDGIYFSFRNDVISQVSRDLHISNHAHVLTLCSDLTSYSQLSSFYVRKPMVDQQAAALLSRSRLMLAALDPRRFAKEFFVTLAGWSDTKFQSPFWEALGRKFFGIDYLSAERAVQGARNRSLIVELMPHYPVYVSLLPENAQACMGQLHEEGELPFEILSGEGFESDKYIDIFDGGPILEAHVSRIKTLATARPRVSKLAVDSEAGWSEMLIAPHGAVADFRCVMTKALVDASEEHVYLTKPAFAALGVAPGARVMVSTW